MSVATIASIGAKYVLPSLVAYLAGRKGTGIPKSAKPDIPEFVTPATIPETTSKALSDLISVKRTAGIRSIREQLGQSQRTAGLNLAASGLTPSTAPGIRASAMGGLQRQAIEGIQDWESQLAQMDLETRLKVADAINEFNLASAQMKYQGDLNAQRRFDSAVTELLDLLGMGALTFFMSGTRAPKDIFTKQLGQQFGSQLGSNLNFGLGRY